MVDMTCSNLLIFCPAKEKVPLLYTTHLQVMMARAMLADEEDVDLEGVEEWCDRASASLEDLLERFDDIYGEGEGALRMAALSEEIDGLRSELNDAKDEAKRESSSSDEDVHAPLKHANMPDSSSVKPIEPAAQTSDPKGNADKPVVPESAKPSKPPVTNSQQPKATSETRAKRFPKTSGNMPMHVGGAGAMGAGMFIPPVGAYERREKPTMPRSFDKVVAGIENGIGDVVGTASAKVRQVRKVSRDLNALIMPSKDKTTTTHQKDSRERRKPANLTISVKQDGHTESDQTPGPRTPFQRLFKFGQGKKESKPDKDADGGQEE